MLNVSNSFKTAVDADTRYFEARVVFHFSSGPVTLYDEDIVDFKILEEIGIDTDNPVVTISSNECDITIKNLNNIFTPTNLNSPYYDDLIPNIKFEVFLSLEVSKDVFEEIQMGTFYTTSWDASSQSLEASISGNDRLMFELVDKKIKDMPVYTDIKTSEVFMEILTGAGISRDEIIIDELINDQLEVFWPSSDNVLDVLNDLCESCFCSMVVTRDNKIRIRNLDQSKQTYVTSITDSNQIKNMSFPQKFYNLYSKINVGYYIPYPDSNETILNVDKLYLREGSNYFSFETDKAGIAWIEGFNITGYLPTTESCYLESIEIYSNKINFKIFSSNTRMIKLEVKGVAINNETKSTFTIENKAIKRKWGEKILDLDNNLIQSRDVAKKIANSLIEKVTNPKAHFRVSLRGNPALEIMDIIRISSPSSDISSAEATVLRSEIFYDGAIEATMDLRVTLRKSTFALIDIENDSTIKVTANINSKIISTQTASSDIFITDSVIRASSASVSGNATLACTII